MNPRLFYLLPLLVLVWSGFWVAGAYREYLKARQAVARLEKEVAQLTQALPGTLKQPPLNPSELPNAYGWVLRAAEARGLELNEFTPNQDKAALVVKGPYEGVLGFLESLEKAPIPLWVEGYSLEPEPPRAERLLLRLELALLVGQNP